MSNTAESATEQTSNRGIFASYYTEDEIADARGVEKPALRKERKRGTGPPWAKVGRMILYPKSGFRAWMREIEHKPSKNKTAEKET
jgi:hypothetical protein